MLPFRILKDFFFDMNEIDDRGNTVIFVKRFFRNIFDIVHSTILASLLILHFFSNPTPTKEALLGNVIWPKVNHQKPDTIQYLNINQTLEVLSNPRDFAKINKLYDYYITYNDII